MFCINCGNEIADGVKFCPNCGNPTNAQPQAQPVQQQSGLCCPSCGSSNVQVQLVEQGQMTTKKGVGFGGHMNNIARGTTAVMTLGMSNLVWKKSKGTNKTNTVTATMGICQNCGNTWTIDSSDNGGNDKKLGWAKGSIFR